MPDISILPERPWTFVAQVIHIVVGYPIGISIKSAVTEIVLLKTVTGIKDRLNAIMLFDNVEPCFGGTSELLSGEVTDFFNVKNRGKVASL